MLLLFFFDALDCIADKILCQVDHEILLLFILIVCRDNFLSFRMCCWCCSGDVWLSFLLQHRLFSFLLLLLLIDLIS